jgi:hypothetical protein
MDAHSLASAAAPSREEKLSVSEALEEVTRKKKKKKKKGCPSRSRSQVEDVSEVQEILSRYPSTPHLPFSPCVQEDDIQLPDEKTFVGRKVVVTEKLDGGNAVLWQGTVFARSVKHAATHASFSQLKQLYSSIWFGDAMLEEDRELALFGELCVAQHSICYDSLPSFFFLFAALNCRTKTWLSFADVCALGSRLDLPVVPILLWDHTFRDANDIQSFMNTRILQPSVCASEHGPEGFVIRVMNSFPVDSFVDNIAKFVRANHVQTSKSWRRTWARQAIDSSLLLDYQIEQARRSAEELEGKQNRDSSTTALEADAETVCAISEKMKEDIYAHLGLQENEVLLMYTYGSRVWGSNNVSKQSDYDVVVVAEDRKGRKHINTSVGKQIDVCLLTLSEYVDRLHEHRIIELLPILAEHQFFVQKSALPPTIASSFKLNIRLLQVRLRKECSKNIKMAAKFGDADMRRARKVLIASYRHCLFFTQLRESRSIVDLACVNPLAKYESKTMSIPSPSQILTNHAHKADIVVSFAENARQLSELVAFFVPIYQKLIGE